MYSTLECLLMKACKNEDLEDELCSFYKDDLDETLLRVQLTTFALHFQQVHGILNKISIFDLKKYFSSLSMDQAALLDQVVKLIQLILVISATNATSERSFSALRRVKTYLRSTMLQERLNYLMLLHIHKERTDKLCIKTAINEFVEKSSNRDNIFGKYKI